MTPDQETQFDLYGCACRCLLALAYMKGTRLTKAQFIDEYSKKEYLQHWNTLNRCGSTSTSSVIEIARGLGLALWCETFVSKAKIRITIERQQSSGILLFTERKLNTDKSLTDFAHCSLVNPILPSESSFSICQVDDWSVKLQCEDWSFEIIDQMLGHFLILHTKWPSPPTDLP